MLNGNLGIECAKEQSSDQEEAINKVIEKLDINNLISNLKSLAKLI